MQTIPHLHFRGNCREVRDEALAIAHECPAAAWASIEVREIGTCYE
jgi:hypothetical protein